MNKTEKRHVDVELQILLNRMKQQAEKEPCCNCIHYFACEYFKHLYEFQKLDMPCPVYKEGVAKE